jgi:hypothetical protein
MRFYIHVIGKVVDVKWENAILHPCNWEGYGCRVGKSKFYIHVTRKVMDVKWENAILHPCNSEGYGCKVGKCNFTSM